MNNKARYLFYHTKALLKRRSTWALIVSIAFFIAVILGINVPDVENTKVGIFTNGGTYAKKIANNIEEKSSIYEIVEYEDADKLSDDVLSGKLECGFVFSKDFDKKAESGRFKETVSYICSPYTTKGLVAKETLYSSFLKFYSETILEENYEKIYGEKDKEAMEYLLKRNMEYQDSQDIFTVDFRNDI